MRVLIRLLGLTILAVSSLHAQELRGTVRDSAAGQPISGAVLILQDSAGRALGRNITNERGVYRIAAIPAMRRMRVVRIGFRPVEVTLPIFTNGIQQIDIVMTSIPTLLEPVKVTSGANCSRRSDRIVALSLLEQARAGLLATIVARDARPAEMIRLRFTQLLEGNTDRIASQEVTIDSSTDVKQSFRAVRSAADFVKLGFLLKSDSSQQFLGPDAETLMDDTFRDGYCFQLRDRDPRRPNQVGLAFVPASSKRDRVDVDGTLWVDTVARELRDIRFDYLGLDRALVRVNPGGRIEFRQLANGITMIDRWSFRIPSVHNDTIWGINHVPLLRSRLVTLESGGEVAAAHWPDGFTWTASLGTAVFHLIDPAGKPLSGRTLVLEGTDYRGTSDSTGALTIGRLLPGPYDVLIQDNTLDAIGVPLRVSQRFSAARGEQVEMTLRVPTARDFVDRACRAVKDEPTSLTGAWFIAKVLSSGGNPVKHAEWKAYSLQDTGWIEIGGGTTDSDGVLQYCGGAFQNHDQVKVEIRTSKKDPWVSALFLVSGPVTGVKFRLPPPTN